MVNTGRLLAQYSRVTAGPLAQLKSYTISMKIYLVLSWRTLALL